MILCRLHTIKNPVDHNCIPTRPMDQPTPAIFLPQLASYTSAASTNAHMSSPKDDIPRQAQVVQIPWSSGSSRQAVRQGLSGRFQNEHYRCTYSGQHPRL